MKYLFLLLTLVGFQMSQAAVLVVDNTPGAGAPYSSLSSAINAASNGDTIMVQPSPTSYGSVNLDKQIVLIGPGYYPENKNTAKVLVLNLRSGSSSSVITGMVIENRIDEDAAPVGNIQILRNAFTGSRFIVTTWVGGHNKNNWLIEGNIFLQSTNCTFCSTIVMINCNNWIFRNNIFHTLPSTANNNGMIEGVNITTSFYHNIFIHEATGPIFNGVSAYLPSQDALLQNNIIWMMNPTSDIQANCTNCTWVHNLTYNPTTTLTLLPGTTNLDNTDPQFVNIPGPSDPRFAWTNDYRCEAGSPGETGASDGGMVGVHGGNYPFRNYLEPAGIPRMLDLILDNVILQQGTNATVRVKAVGGSN